MLRRVSKLLRLHPGSAGKPGSRRGRFPRIVLEALEDRLTPSGSTVRFAVMGDYGVAQQPEQDVATLIHSWNPDFITTTGDNNYSTPPLTTASYDTTVGQYYHDFINPYSGIYGAAATSNRFWPAMGEHDWGGIGNNPTGDQAYLSFFSGLPSNKRYYTVTQGPVQLFILDTDPNEPDQWDRISTQAQWLQGALASSTAPWKLVVMSYPPYSSGTEGSTGDLQLPYQAWGASAVVSGHDHFYERLIEDNNFPYFVVGTGGAGLEAPPASLIAGSKVQASVWGALKVDASPSQITFSFVNTAGTVLDTYTMNYVLPAAPRNLTTTAVSSTQINLKWTDNSTNETGYAIERSTDGTNFSQVATADPATTNYLDSGLTAGTTYYYRVTAYNAGGSSAYSNQANTVTPAPLPPIGPPTNLSASVASASRVNLAWTDNSAGQYSFQIERSTDGSTYAVVATVGTGVTSYADTGLTSATYYYQVVATTALSNNRGATAVVGAVLAPAAPSNLTAAAVSLTQINLKWTNNAGNATGFKIQRSTDGTNFTTIATASPAASNYLDSGLTASTTYYYRVAASNASGSSAYSNKANAITPAPLPPIGSPTNLSASVASASGVNLAWTDNSAGLYSFQIERSTDGSTYAVVATVGAGVTSYADTGLTSATYYYQVVAMTALSSNRGGTAVVGAVLAPAAPSNLTATAVSLTQINLKWTNNAANATGFNVQRSTDGTNFTTIATAGPATTNYLDSGLTASTTYYYRVAATNASGSSAYSSKASTVTPAPLAPIGPPTNLSASVASASKVNLAWTDNSAGLYSYQIERSTDGSTYTLIATVGRGVTSYADTGLTSATYYYQIVATTALSSNRGATAVVGAVLAPAAPGNLTATAVSSTQINLKWTNKAANATGFNIQRSTDGTNFTTIATAGPATNYLDSGLTAGTAYYYRVAASNAAGNSAYSNTANATIPSSLLPSLTAPTNLTASVASASKVNLAWTDNSAGLYTFQIERSTDGSTYALIATTGMGATSYADTGLTSATYYYQVVGTTLLGVNMGATAVVGAVLAPAAPGALTAAAVSDTQINLKWTNNAANATRFNIQRSTDGTNFTQIATASAAITNYLDSGLTASTTYYYRVAAANASGSSAYSNTGSATIQALVLPPIGPPANLSASVASASQVNLAWTDNSGGLYSYQIERSTDGSTYVLIATTGMGATSYADTGLAPATYYYQVVGTTNVGDNRGATAVVGAVLAPAAPGSLSATAVSGTQINLKWTNNAANATGFNIQRSTDGTNFTTIATASPATNYLDSGLTASTTYYYRVAAANASGSSAYSSTGSATIQALVLPPIGPPTKLTASVASASQVNLAWTDNSGGLYSYQIERSTDGNTFTLIATTAMGATSYADTGLTSATYYYQVVGTTNVGDNRGGTAVVGAVLAPAAPGALTATAVSGTQINLKWTNNAANATGVKIQRSTDGTNFTTVATAGPAATNYLDSGRTASTTYYYRVAAANASGSSAYSNTGSATIQALVLAPIGPPTKLSASVASASQVNLSWTDNSGGLYSYQIERSTDGSTYVLIATTGTGATSYADTGLAPATYYYQVVGTTNVGDNRGATAVVGAVLAPAAPGNLTATVVFSHQINLTWTNNASNATGFNILESTDAVNFTSVGTVGVNTTNFTRWFLDPSTTYYYQVSAVNASGSASAATVSADTMPPTPPLAASNLTATALDAHHIKLSWTDNSNPPNVEEDAFAVYRSSDGINFIWKQAPARDVTAYTDPDTLSPGTTYYYQIRAFNVDGFAPPSNTASAATLPLPAAPSNLTATAVSGTQISLSWTDNSASPSAATSFKIYRSTDQVSWAWFASTGQGVTSYTWNGASPAATYYFYVTASNSLGDSTPSNTASATTLSAPKAPSNLTATAASATSVNLSWTDNSVSPNVATNFKLYRSTDNVTFSWFASAGQGATTYTWGGGSAGSTYYFYVTASSATGDSAPSNTATVTTPAPPAAPSNLAGAAVSTSQVNLAWTDNSVSPNLATSFKIYRSSDNVSFSWFASAAQGATSYSWFGGSPGTTYYFYVTASDSAGDSAASNTATVTTMGLPAAPSNLTAMARSSAQVDLTWKDNSGTSSTNPAATSFKLYRSTDNVSWSWFATPGQGVTTYIWWGGSASTTYYFYITAAASTGDSAASNTSSTTTTGATSPSAAPAAPSNLALTVVSSGQINLSWTSNDTVQNGFNLFRSTDGTNFTEIATTGATITSYQDMGLSASTTYYYKINAYDSVGASAYSNTANATTNAPGHLSRQLPSESARPEVTYHGGPLLQHVQVESVYAGQAWSSDASLQQQMQQLDGFLNYFVDSPYLDALKQYHIASGTLLGHDVVTQDPSASQMIDDSQIRALLAAEIAAQHVPASTGSTLYVLFTAPGVVVTADGQDSITGFAGYHSVFTDASGATVYYAVVPYPSGDLSALPLTAVQQATVVLSHEVSEAITDPDTHSGWFDPRLGEIGDITAGQVGSMHGYAVQAVWSQVDGKGVIPTGTSATTVGVAGSRIPASAGPLKRMVITERDADARTTSASFEAFFHPDDSASAPGGSKDPPALLTGQTPASGPAFAPTVIAVTSVATVPVGAIPHGSPWATSLPPAQALANVSGGDDHSSQILKDRMPAAGSAVPRQEAFRPTVVPDSDHEVVRAIPSHADLWSEATTAYFAEQAAAERSVQGDVLAPWLLAVAVAAKQDENRPCAESNGRRLRTRHAGSRPSTDEARHAR